MSARELNNIGIHEAMEMMVVIGSTLRAVPFDDFRDSLDGKEVQSDVSEAAGLMTMIRSMGGAR